EKAMNAVAALNMKLSGRSRVRTREDLARKLESIMAAAGRFLSCTVEEEDVETFRQAKRGRPGPDTRYVRSVRKRFHIAVEPRMENIAYDGRCDGTFPLITNTSLTPGESCRTTNTSPGWRRGTSR
ncbi:Transposase-like protein, partial [mine drainage metagenome]